MAELPPNWTLGASSFNWTREIQHADRTAIEITGDIAASGVADEIELELGQVLRTFPAPSSAECAELRATLSSSGGRITVVGISLDDYDADGAPRELAQRESFLAPQLRAAALLGADGVRLPLGQAGPELLRRILPLLEELDLVLHEEIHGAQDPEDPALAAALDALREIDPVRLRVALDTSMLMTSIPPTYLEAVSRLGAPEAFVRTLGDEWPDPGVRAQLRALLGESIPPALRSLLMSMMIRFGSIAMDRLRPILPQVASVHLKFWDLEDPEAVAAPLRALAPELRAAGFAGPLSSEWGGHDWLDADASGITRAHLSLAREALSA